MIIVFKSGADISDVAALAKKLESLNAKVFSFDGDRKIFSVTDAENVDADVIKNFPCVESVVRVTKPYKLVKKASSFGFSTPFAVIAGPCSVESEKSIYDIAAAVKKAGATMLRGGAFKPRTSPYSFQGLGKVGIDLLVKAGRTAGLPVVSEITGVNELDFFTDVDVLQIGARNMQNYELLRAVGRCGKPVIIKRGFANTVDEWLLSAEYVLAGGNDKVVLCERGVRTVASANKAVIDYAAVGAVKKLSGLPVIIDPSHASDSAQDVMPLAVAAAAVGADGVMIETHTDPENALSDGGHQLTPDQLEKTIKKIEAVLIAAK